MSLVVGFRKREILTDSAVGEIIHGSGLVTFLYLVCISVNKQVCFSLA